MPNRPKKLQKERAKQMFIYGVEKDGVVVYPTLDEMAKELGVNRITIWRWAKEEGWHKEREEVQRQREQSLKESLAKHLQTKADEQAESIAERLMKANEAVYRTALAGLMAVANRIKVLKENAEQGERIGDELKKSAEALRHFYEVLRESLGDKSGSVWSFEQFFDAIEDDEVYSTLKEALRRIAYRKTRYEE